MGLLENIKKLANKHKTTELNDKNNIETSSTASVDKKSDDYRHPDPYVDMWLYTHKAAREERTDGVFSESKRVTVSDYQYEFVGGAYQAIVNDRTKTEYGPIESEINGYPVKLWGTFNGCTNLKKPPEIPEGVTSLFRTFNGCTSLTDLSDFVIPNSVKDMNCTFNGCTNLEIPPEIPDSVTSMFATFQGCTSLTVAPEIPDSVTKTEQCFDGCINLQSLADNILSDDEKLSVPSGTNENDSHDEH